MTGDRKRELAFSPHLSPVTVYCFSPVSVADLSEWARPAGFALAALASIWVFHDARGRAEFGAASVWAWALLTLLFPPAALPLYLAARLYTRRAAPATPPSPVEVAAASEPLDEAEKGDGGETVERAQESRPAGGLRARRRFAPTLLYTAALVCAGAAYFYVDYQSFDARLARAERAKLYRRPEEAIREYRAALRLREDAHTRQLLGLELLQAGRAEEALAELRAAARGAAPDEVLTYHLAAALDALGRRAEAAAAYRQFLDGCAPAQRDGPCAAAGARLRALESPSP